MDRLTHPVWGWTQSHRCLYLFLALVLLLVLLPVFDHSEAGQLRFSAASLLVLFTSVVALGRSRVPFWVALSLVGVALGLLVLSHATGDAGYRVWSWRFSVAVLVATIVQLLRYVFRPEEMTTDKLFGGAAAYLQLGLLWSFLYALVENLAPGSFVGLGGSGVPHVADMVFFSYGTITTGGLADITPRGKLAHALVILEELAGTLFMAMIVARLVATYHRPASGPAEERRGR